MSSKRDTCKTVIAPGIWIDMDGCGHISLPDMFKHLDIPDTPEMREAATQMAMEIMRRSHPNAKLILRDKPDE